MQNIGEKLEDARKRNGISIREASEATKIRADFLIDFENNRFDQDLPDIYKRGFIRIYAKFLGLDDEKMLADFAAAQLGGYSSGATRRERSQLGEVEVDNYQTHYVAEDYRDAEEGDKTLYLKIGIIMGLVIIMMMIVGLIVSVLTSSGSDSDDTAAASSVTYSNTAETTARPSSSSTSSTTSSAQVDTGKMLVVVSGGCELMVRDAATRAILHRGSHQAGDRIPLDISGRVEVVSTEIQHVQVERNGRTLRGAGSGLGKFFVQ